MADRICPIMSRPVFGDADTGIYIAEVACLRERCAAWAPPGNPYLEASCFLTGRVI